MENKYYSFRVDLSSSDDWNKKMIETIDSLKNLVRFHHLKIKGEKGLPTWEIQLKLTSKGGNDGKM